MQWDPHAVGGDFSLARPSLGGWDLSCVRSYYNYFLWGRQTSWVMNQSLISLWKMPTSVYYSLATPCGPGHHWFLTLAAGSSGELSKNRFHDLSLILLYLNETLNMGIYILLRKKKLSKWILFSGWGASNQITFLKISLSRPTFRCWQEKDS